MPEYDPLADLYDFEYDHAYDLYLWLKLAECKSESVIEWGAGTGRISAPRAEAGHTVTAIELSEPMVGRGRAKGEDC